MKTIKERTKKAFLVALSTVAALSLGAGVGVVNAYAENDTAKLESFQTGGASIRLVGSWGIRFQTTLDLTDYADLTAENSGFVTGVLAIPTDKLAKAEDLTIENENVANGVTFDGTVNKWQVNKDDATVMETYGYLDGEEIPELSYSRNISFRGYYTVGGETVYGNVQTRSLTYVAQAALYDDQTNTEKDVLSDTQEDTAEKYVKDYKVVYVNQDGNKLYENTVVSHTVENGEIVANNDEENRVAAPERFGYVFGESTVCGKAWNFESEKLTGDTVVKVESEASKTLDFSTATEVPTHLAVNKNVNGIDKEMRIDETTKALYGSGWASDTFTVSFAEPMTLNAGDKVVVELDVPSEKWFQINLLSVSGDSIQIFDNCTQIRANSSIDNAANYVRKRDFCFAYYELPEGELTFQTVKFTHTQSIAVEFYVKSIKIEEANTLSNYDYYNVDFSNTDSIPSGYVTSTSNLKIGLDETQNALWIGERRADFRFNYPNIVLEEGDTITLTLTSPMGGGNIKLNTSTNYTWVNVSEGTYVDRVYTVGEGGLTLSNITFMSYNTNGGAEYYVKSVKIEKPSTKISSSVDFTAMSLNEATYKYSGAFSCATNGSSVGFVTDTVDGEEKTVLKASGVQIPAGTNKANGLYIAFDDLGFTLTNANKVEIKVKAVTQADKSYKLAAYNYKNSNYQLYSEVDATTGWATLTVKAKAEDTTNGFDADEVLSGLYLAIYNPNYTVDIYVASIVIS